jgi:hypothetical protein
METPTMTMTPPAPAVALDEAGKRAPGFREGVRVRLGDGQGWHLKPPRVRYTPTRGEDGRLRFGPRQRDDGEYQRLLDAAAEADGGSIGMDTALSLVAHVLQSNYTLSDDDLVVLLPFLPDDPANEEMWSDAYAAAVGSIRPKP